MAGVVKIKMIFQRHEKKYMTSEETRELLRRYLREYMRGDPYGTHTVCSLYMDTEDLLIAHCCMLKPKYYDVF